LQLKSRQGNNNAEAGGETRKNSSTQRPSPEQLAEAALAADVARSDEPFFHLDETGTRRARSVTSARISIFFGKASDVELKMNGL
jgi:hypothetical protein